MAASMAIGTDEIVRRFGYHPATTETGSLHQGLRLTVARVAGDFDNWLPDSREKSLALTALQEALMWANAAAAMQAPVADEWGTLRRVASESVKKK